MRTLLFILSSILFVACSKDKTNDTPAVSIIGSWDSNSAGITFRHLQFTKDNKFFAQTDDGSQGVTSQDDGQYKYDGNTLTTSFIDYYAGGIPVRAYDTASCVISGNTMVLKYKGNRAEGRYTRQN